MTRHGESVLRSYPFLQGESLRPLEKGVKGRCGKPPQEHEHPLRRAKPHISAGDSTLVTLEDDSAVHSLKAFIAQGVYLFSQKFF